jgi:hypothetical protein
MTILNNTAQELYYQNLGESKLGRASATKGLFVDRSDGGLLNAGQFVYNDQWDCIAAGNGIFSATNAGIVPFADNNTRRLGSASLRWSGVFGVNFFPGAGVAIWTSGAGTPEGAVTAVVGSLFTRTDGGSNTTLYVKESGSGNTGWVAK